MVQKMKHQSLSAAMRAKQLDKEKEKTHPTIWMWTRQKSRRQ